MNGPQHQLLDAAMSAADRGWHVFPLRPGDKRPAVRDWEERATTDRGRIRACWTSGPYNVGIACGPSGLVVLDLDMPKDPAIPRRNGTGEVLRDGRDALANVAQQAGQPFPADTYTVTTRSGGKHLYFVAPASEALRNTAGRIGRLIDTRAAGGYVVAAGSVVGGVPYRVHTHLPVAPLRTWIAAALKQEAPRTSGAPATALDDVRHRSRYAASALRAEIDHVRSAEPGTRNHMLNAAAYSLGQLVAAGLLPDEPTADALARAARATGLGDREINSTIRSGMTAGSRRPRAISS